MGIQIHKERTFPRLILLSKWLFYISSIVYSIVEVLATIFYCFAPKYYFIPRNLINIAYTLQWVGVLLIYFGRLKLVFKGTSYQLTNRLIHCFSISFFILFVLSIACIIGFYFDQVIIANMMTGAILIVAVILSQALAWTFVRKLKAIQLHLGDENMIEREKLTKTVKKYSILSVTSVMGSSVTAISMLIAYFLFAVGIVPVAYIYSTTSIIRLVVVMDVFIDSLSMTLSLHTNEEYFKMLCCICMKVKSVPNLTRKLSAEITSGATGEKLEIV